MAYTPTEWKNGDVITAEKLNNLEEGVQEVLTNDGGGRLIATPNHNNVLDKTWQQIYDAFPNVAIEIGHREGDIYLEAVSAISGNPTENTYTFWTEGQNNYFMATAPDDYPVLDNE